MGFKNNWKRPGKGELFDKGENGKKGRSEGVGGAAKKLKKGEKRVEGRKIAQGKRKDFQYTDQETSGRGALEKRGADFVGVQGCGNLSKKGRKKTVKGGGMMTRRWEKKNKYSL